MFAQHSSLNCSRANASPSPVVTVDPTTKFTTQYNLAVKYYLQRNFNKSFKLVHPLVEELRTNPNVIGPALVAKLAKVYFSLLSLLLNEVINTKLLKLSIPRHSLNFPDYLSGQGDMHFADAILDDFNNNGLYRLVGDLHLSDNEQIVLMCFMTESSNNMKAESLKKQVESYLSLRGLYPGPISDSILGADDGEDSTLRKILQLYLSQVILKYYGVEKAINIIERLFVIDEAGVQKWVAWIQNCDKNARSASSEEEDDEDEDDDAIYDESYGESEEEEYVSDITAITTNTTATITSKSTAPLSEKGVQDFAARTLSTQSALTHTSLTDTPHAEPNDSLLKSKKKSKSKAKSRGRGKSKLKTRSVKAEDSSLITITNNYMTRQLSTFKDLVTRHLGRYPVVVKLVTFVIFLLLILARGSGGLHQVQLKKKLVAFYSKVVQTAQLAFKCSFL